MSLLVISGNDEFRRQRLLRTTIQKLALKGAQSLNLEGGTGELQSILGSVGLFFPESVVVTLSEPDKEPQEVLLQQWKSPNENVMVICLHEGNIRTTSKFYKDVVSVLPKNSWKEFESAPEYKRDDLATDFAVSEAKSQGVTLDPTLAKALVDRVGNDLGVIYFEVMKASVVTPKGSGISAATLRSTLSHKRDSKGSILVESIGTKNLVWTLKELEKIRSFYGSEDPTMAIAGQFLGPSFLKWLQAASLSKEGFSASAAAELVGANPWVWENKILPFALNWGVDGCKDLVSLVGTSQRNLMSGQLFVWDHFQVRLLDLLRGK